MEQDQTHQTANMLSCPPLSRPPLVYVCVCLVVAQHIADPDVVLANAGVETRVSLLGTLVTPGHHTLQLTITHQGATRITLRTLTHRHAHRKIKISELK